MADIYIATPTQADYDALMRLAEAAGYEWYSGETKPTALNFYNEYVESGGQVIHFCVDFKALMHCDREYFEKMGATIETIPNLSSIVAIYRTENMDWDEYAKTHPVSGVQPSLMFPCFVEHNDGSIYFLSNHKPAQALAIECKPKESEEVMPEKVKLPKFMCDWLKGFEKDYPLNVITKVNRLRKLEHTEVSYWLSADVDNQWLLIDALRYGYEAEPEPRWGIKAGNCYMDNTIEWSFYSITNTSVTLDEFAYFNDKNEADDMVKTLGFGEVVDLNKEVEADD